MEDSNGKFVLVIQIYVKKGLYGEIFRGVRKHMGG